MPSSPEVVEDIATAVHREALRIRNAQVAPHLPPIDDVRACADPWYFVGLAHEALGIPPTWKRPLGREGVIRNGRWARA